MGSNSTNGSVSASSVSGSTTYADYYYQNANDLDTQNCYGYIQATYTSDGGVPRLSESLHGCLVTALLCRTACCASFACQEICICPSETDDVGSMIQDQNF